MNRKAIIIGNGFSSQIIPNLSSKKLLERVRATIPYEMDNLEQFFDAFRIKTERILSREAVIYKYDRAYIDEEDFTMANASIVGEKRNAELYNWVAKILSEKGVSNIRGVYDQYFVVTGLFAEVFESSFTNIETPIKVLRLWKIIQPQLSIDEDKVESAIIDAFCNDNELHIRYKGHLLHQDKLNYEKARIFFREFCRIFTTNYDCILDDLNASYVYHLHGGFNGQEGNKNIDIVLGADAFEKKQIIKTPNHSSEIERYFKILESDEMSELHIFGFSGLNDQHIIDAIQKNRSIKRIIYYCRPLDSSDIDVEASCKHLFARQKQSFELRSWNEIWEKIV